MLNRLSLQSEIEMNRGDAESTESKGSEKTGRLKDYTSFAFLGDLCVCAVQILPR